jgi:hypothetical protein
MTVLDAAAAHSAAGTRLYGPLVTDLAPHLCGAQRAVLRLQAWLLAEGQDGVR